MSPQEADNYVESMRAKARKLLDTSEGRRAVKALADHLYERAPKNIEGQRHVVLLYTEAAAIIDDALNQESA